MKYLAAILLAFVFSGCVVSREKYYHDLKIMALDEANFRDRVGELEKRVREIERKVDLNAESREKRSNLYQKAAEEAGKRTDEKLIERSLPYK